MSITTEALAKRYPLLFHMAELGSWPSIQKYGLRSTSALLDMYEIHHSARATIECYHRPKSVQISHPNFGRAVIRDQKPMSEKHLLLQLANNRGPVLRDGLTPSDWYRILNSKVFFWLNRERLKTLLRARAYRTRRHTILAVDTKSLLASHLNRVFLSPINSGNTHPYPQPRGLSTFLSPREYPFEMWRQKRRLRGEPIVELAVEHSVPDIRHQVVRVEEDGADRPPELIWTKL